MSDLDPRFVEGVRLARQRAYYEAHEALEEVWRDAPAGEAREALQAVIQLCVALEHLRRDNALGAFNVWNRARGKLQGAPATLHGLGVAAFAEAVTAFCGEARLADRVKTQLGGGLPADDAPTSPPPPLPPDERWPVPPVEGDLATALG